MTREEAIKELSKLIFELGFEDNVDDKVYALNMAIQALSQEPSRNMEEIAEVIKSDVDAETKCKMISNILTAKPHYFEKQEPCTDAVKVCEIYADVNDCENGAQELCGQCIHYKEPCDDAISREDAFEIIASNDTTDGTELIFTGRQVVALLSTLPSVTQKSGKWQPRYNIFGVTFCSECGYELKINNTNYCPNCGAKMESEEK